MQKGILHFYSIYLHTRSYIRRLLSSLAITVTAVRLKYVCINSLWTLNSLTY